MPTLTLADAAKSIGMSARSLQVIARRGDFPTTRQSSYPHAFIVDSDVIEEWYQTFSPGRSRVPFRLRGDHAAQVRELSEVMPNGCIEFRGYISPTTGYGQVGRNIPAHRVAYEASIGPIPSGLHLDHLCRNISCVNPLHLEPVTIGENVARGNAPSAMAHRAGTCVKGHPVAGWNAYLRPNDGRFECRKCRNERSAASRERARDRRMGVAA